MIRKWKELTIIRYCKKDNVHQKKKINAKKITERKGGDPAVAVAVNHGVVVVFFLNKKAMDWAPTLSSPPCFSLSLYPASKRERQGKEEGGDQP